MHNSGNDPMADISSNNTLNNQGEPPEVIDSTQESPVPSQIHPESFWMRMVRKQSLTFLPILTSHRICLISL